MLALSLLLSVIFAFQATIHLLTRKTSFKILSTILSFLQPFLIPALLLLTLNLYSSNSSTKPILSPITSSHYLTSIWNFLSSTPLYWEVILRTSSPLFVILEGMSTLLCIQALSRFSGKRIERSSNPEVLQLLFLILSAAIYVSCAYFLWESYDSVPDRIGATLIGVAVTSVLFLSGISFALRKGNVVETSLVLALVSFHLYLFHFLP